METIKVFLGMEIGRFDGYEYLKVLKTYPNGSKLCWFDHDTVSEPDEDEAWDDLWLAQPDEKFGWYAIDSMNVRVNLGQFTQGWLSKIAEFDR